MGGEAKGKMHAWSIYIYHCKNKIVILAKYLVSTVA